MQHLCPNGLGLLRETCFLLLAHWHAAPYLAVIQVLPEHAAACHGISSAAGNQSLQGIGSAFTHSPKAELPTIMVTSVIVQGCQADALHSHSGPASRESGWQEVAPQNLPN